MTTLFTKSTKINGLKLITREPATDKRGYLDRLFCLKSLEADFDSRKIIQINHSFTEKEGTIRGLHYQKPPSGELKIVTCLKGEVFDVAVDLRKDSPTFLHWHGEILTEKNKLSLMIPEGFAHGFQTLTNNCELIYFHTKAYDRASEAGINAVDPCIKIKWPIAISHRSERDEKQSFLSEQYEGIVI